VAFKKRLDNMERSPPPPITASKSPGYEKVWAKHHLVTRVFSVSVGKLLPRDPSLTWRIKRILHRRLHKKQEYSDMERACESRSDELVSRESIKTICTSLCVISVMSKESSAVNLVTSGQCGERIMPQTMVILSWR
jgi:hypothetical protein